MSPVNVVWIMVVASVLALLQGVMFSLFNLRKLTYRRYFSRNSVSEGEQLELVEVIRNVKLLPVPWLRAESRISPNLRFGSAAINEEREISANRYHRSVFFMGPFSQITRRHTVTCLKRGHYEAGSVALTAGDLFGLGQKTRQVNLPCSVDVYPRILSEDELGTPSTRWQGDLAVKRWIMPDPFLTSGVRDYREGDPLRDIHWRASARMGQLQVKVRDYTADPRMMVVLNVKTSEEQWGDLMDYEQEGIEQGVRIAATLCLRALNEGVEAGFACNGCLQGDRGTGKTVFVRSSSASDQAEVLLSTMARMEIHWERNFSTFMETLGDVTNTDILILSTYDSEAIRYQMDMLRRAGNSVTFMQLERGKRHEQSA